MRDVLVGIDAGTTVLKLACFNLDGSYVYEAQAPVELVRPSAHEVMLDMNQLWRSIAELLKGVSLAGLKPAAIAVTGQGDGAWLVDDSGDPTGLAVTWLDARAKESVHEFEASGKAAKIQLITGSSIFPGTLPVILEHYRTVGDERLARARWQLNCKDWIGFKLTGEIATDPTEASRTYLDPDTSEYSDELLETLGHQEFKRLLPPVLEAQSLRGEVNQKASIETGLEVGIPVMVGVVDTALPAVALGLHRSSQRFAILGTTAVVGAISEKKIASELPGRFNLGVGLNGYVTSLLAPMNGAPNLDWALHTLGYELKELDQIIERVPPGSNGVIFHPYLAAGGERAPFLDVDASGSFFGVSATTTRSDILRAVVEGIAFSVNECLLELGDFDELFITGGMSKSDAWCQLFADVTGSVVARSQQELVGLKTLALEGGRAAGVNVTWGEGAQDDLHHYFKPRLEEHKQLAEIMGLFIQLREAVSPLWWKLRSSREGRK